VASIPEKLRQNTFVRILDAGGKAVGAGFMVSDRHVLTCAHVVQDTTVADAPVAWRRPAGLGTVWVNLAFVDPERALRAKLVAWGPEAVAGPPRPNAPPPANADWALLEIVEECGPAVPVRTDMNDAFDQRFWSFGVTGDADMGTNVYGKVASAAIDRVVQLLADNDYLQYVQRGFSGAAVWNVGSAGVIGMKVAIDPDGDRQWVHSAYMIPIRHLMDQLRRYDITLETTAGEGTSFGRLPWSPSLMHFADRGMQIDPLVDALTACWRQPKRHLVCVIHGDSREAHDSLLQRLHHDPRVTKVIAGHGGRAPLIEEVDWPVSTSRDLSDGLKALKSQMKRLFHTDTADPAAIAAAINGNIGPNGISVSISSRNFGRGQRGLINEWLGYWQGVASHELTKPLVLFLCLRYHHSEQPLSLIARLLGAGEPAALKRYLNSGIAECAASAHFEKILELEQLESHDVRKWVDDILTKTRPDLTRHADWIGEEVLKAVPKRTSIHMEEFLSAVVSVRSRMWPNAEEHG